MREELTKGPSVEHKKDADTLLQYKIEFRKDLLEQFEHFPKLLSEAKTAITMAQGDAETAKRTQELKEMRAGFVAFVQYLKANPYQLRNSSLKLLPRQVRATSGNFVDEVEVAQAHLATLKGNPLALEDFRSVIAFFDALQTELAEFTNISYTDEYQFQKLVDAGKTTADPEYASAKSKAENSSKAFADLLDTLEEYFTVVGEKEEKVNQVEAEKAKQAEKENEKVKAALAAAQPPVEPLETRYQQCKKEVKDDKADRSKVLALLTEMPQLIKTAKDQWSAEILKPKKEKEKKEGGVLDALTSPFRKKELSPLEKAEKNFKKTRSQTLAFIQYLEGHPYEIRDKQKKLIEPSHQGPYAYGEEKARVADGHIRTLRDASTLTSQRLEAVTTFFEDLLKDLPGFENSWIRDEYQFQFCIERGTLKADPKYVSAKTVASRSQNAYETILTALKQYFAKVGDCESELAKRANAGSSTTADAVDAFKSQSQRNLADSIPLSDWAEEKK